MAEFKLGRIRFVWKNTWTSETEYYQDDVVRYGGRSYVCVKGHLSSADFNTDLELSPTRWNLMSDGQDWKGNWSVATFYKLNDLVKYGGMIYNCIDSHTSAATSALGLEADSAKWQLFAEGFDWKGDWSVSTRYKLNDLVRYGGILYLCNTHHTAASTLADGLEVDSAKWDKFNEGIEYKSAWVNGTRYKLNDIVKYGAGTWICTQEHEASAAFATDIAYWDQLVEGFEFQSDWNSATEYQPGDVVAYGGNQYVSRTINSNENPRTSTANWFLYSQGLKFITDWSISTSYKIGEVVRIGGYTYLATTDSPSVSLTITSSSAATSAFTTSDTTSLVANMAINFTASTFGNVFNDATYYIKQVLSSTEFTVSQLYGGETFTPTTASGSMSAIAAAQPPNTSYWSRLNGGIRWLGDWSDDYQYVLGDAVRYGDNAYICVQAHRSEGDDGSTLGAQGGGAANSRPDQDSSGIYWNLLSVGNEQSVLTTVGDLIYYGGAGPTRLPVGTEGQILRVSPEGVPEWVTQDASEYSYYVAPHGIDQPAPISGLTVDKPWKSIRYACEQIENGPRNPSAKYLLELNRAFIQKEVTEWIKYQIANDISPFTSSFDYDEYRCERDTGFLVDAFIHDIGHGGNVKTRGAANALVGGLLDSPGTYLTLASEKEEDIAAWTYMLEVITSVLGQTAPAVNYQELNGDNSTAIVAQYTNSSYSAEPTALTEITSLLQIITNAVNDGNADNIPARYAPNSLINLKTGRYREVLPIIVPAETCILGEEVRSVNAGPQGSVINITDAKYSIGAIDHITSIIGDIVEGNSVTPSGDNETAQSQLFPFADSTQSDDLKKLLRTIKYRIDWSIDGGYVFNLTEPTNYNTSYLVGYGDARKLVKENRKFFQEEIRAYLAANYPDLKYSKTTCLRDVGYIIDSLVYDLTYGGNAMSVMAGLAYYEGVGSSLYINSTELTATVAAYEYLKTIVTEAAGNTPTGGLQLSYNQYRDTAGSAAAITALGDNIDAIIDVLQNGPSAVGSTVTLSDPSTSWVSGALTGAYSALSAASAQIAEDTTDYINENFGSFKYDSAKCRRDLGIILDGIYYDAAFNTNYNARINGISYTRAYASEVLTGQLNQTVGALIYARDRSLEYVLGNTTAQARITSAFNEIIDIINNGAASADALTFTSPTGGDVNKTYARQQLQANRTFIRAEVIAWIKDTYPALVFDEDLCSRDVGYIVDAISYDVQYGGNTATRYAAQSYFENAVSILPAAQKIATANAFQRMKDILGDIVIELPVTKTTTGSNPNTETQDTSGTVASSTEVDEVTGLAQIIENVIAADSISGLPAESAPSIAWVEDTLEAALTELASNTSVLQALTLQYINTTYSDFNYNISKCARDVQTVLKSVGYDFMFNSNYQTVKSAHSYLRATASEVFSLGQKTVTRSALTFARDQALLNVAGDSTAQSRVTALFEIIDDVLYGATTEGNNCATGVRNYDYAVHQLEMNRTFIVQDVLGYITDTYKATCSQTVASTDIITCDDTSWMVRNMAVRFTGILPGMSSETTYYVQKIISSTTFKIATTRFAADADVFQVADTTQPFEVRMYYNEELCLRDVGSYIDALKYDIKFTGNYKSFYAAKYYANAVIGSLEENMYLVRNGTGIRNQTLDGLTGDLTPENEYGTSRVTAGAYVSLDPGWGPDDYRTWVTSRSCYVQNVTTFGYAAIGQKIDGALHNGGNDSIVSNDFTQLISDGIGAWVLNNGRAELVSVFTYYSHIGYLAESGGRIRAANGNNSYGDFGAAAEGFDTSEVPNTAIVDNRFQYDAIVGSVITDATDILFQYEFDHAGNDYTEATWTISGSGNGASAEQDEFRDGAVFEVRLLDNVDDSTDGPADGNLGGFGYISNSNTSQGGSSSSLTLAATDPQNSSDYVGMKLFLTGGSGAGQYGIITTYNSGTKVANVVKESDGTPGWDHVLAGYTIETPDASTTYTVEPAISFTAPPTATGFGLLPGTNDNAWVDVKFGATTEQFTALSGTSTSAGENATFDVVRNGYKYIVSVNNGGLGYERLDTITIPYTSLGGVDSSHDLTLTVTAINSVTGAILEVDQSGYGVAGKYVAIKANSRQGAVSYDGETWTDVTLMMPSTANWTSLAYGLFDDGSTNVKVSKFVAVASGSTAAAWSDDGESWNATTLPASANWVSVTYGEGRFVAIASNSTTVAISLDGINWDVTGALTTTGFTSVAYGRGLWVAVKSGSDTANYSGDGVTWEESTLPASAAWSSITYGKQKFIAVASDSNTGALSLDGANWVSLSMGSVDSSVAGYQKIAYGQGVFAASAWLTGLTGYTYVAKSDDGLIWTSLGLPDGGKTLAGFGPITFGNPYRSGKWVVLAKEADNSPLAAYFTTGAKARARAFVAENRIFAIRIHEPGSGYATAPTITITDPNNTFEAPTQVRIGNGVLGTPSYVNKGTGYLNADAALDTGDGYADLFQFGQYIAVRRITERPVPGSNVVFGHLPDQTFKLVSVLTFVGLNDGAYTAFFQIAPEMKQFSPPPDGTSVTTRIRYSQVRMTGHDFLSIGTGNFVESNYPGNPLQPAIQANETVESNGGRVFFTSTDQDGNFRVGDLFTIEQSTGVATLNADAFNIAGLQELTLGEVALGGGSASITEFSTDPFFSADSDSIVPTQRAIKAYISAQIGGGGASLNVNTVTAGFIFISGNTISTTTGAIINMRAKFNFKNDIRGIPNAWNYFLR